MNIIPCSLKVRRFYLLLFLLSVKEATKLRNSKTMECTHFQ